MAPRTACQATKADGSRCNAPGRFIDPETGLCPAHKPGASERLSEFGRKGAEAAKQARRGEGLDPDELPVLDSPQAAERWAEVVGRAVATGKLTHAQGKAISSLLREWRQSHEAGNVRDRIERLQEQLAELKGANKRRSLK